jgi:flagella basal body P-ring formation protein FlgA
MNAISLHLFAVAALLVTFNATAAEAQELIVQLSDKPVAVSGPTVHVGDLAKVICNDRVLQQKIENLDLDSRPRANGSESTDMTASEITRRQVEIRILVSGMSREAFVVTGAKKTTLQWTTPESIARRLETLLGNSIEQQFGLEQGAITVRLMNESQLVAVEQSLSGPRFELKLFPQRQVPLGRVRLDAELIDSAGQRRSHHFDANVMMKTRVAIADQPFGRGQTITEDLIRVVTRSIVNRSPIANPDELVGKVATRSIDRDEILLASHVTKPDRRRYPVVRRNDLLDVVVRIGGADVRLKNARAMESGRIGDTIEVLNTRTNKRLSASIVSKNVAAVDLGVTRR